MKITFLGDIMCEPPVRKAYLLKDGSYNFDGLFANVKALLGESDYVVGNLEAPLAGEEAKYTYEFYSFNAPDESVDAMNKVSIRTVSTVNNHTFDCGLEGMKRRAWATPVPSCLAVSAMRPFTSRWTAPLCRDLLYL